MINEVQPKIKFQNIVQCPFNILEKTIQLPNDFFFTLVLFYFFSSRNMEKLLFGVLWLKMFSLLLKIIIKKWPTLNFS